MTTTPSQPTPDLESPDDHLEPADELGSVSDELLHLAIPTPRVEVIGGEVLIPLKAAKTKGTG